MENVKNKSLYNILKDSEPSKLDQIVKEVLFQLAYLLVVFEDLGIMHNDLHQGNIFVGVLPKPRRLSFCVTSGRSLVLDITYFVRVFDFDRSVKKSTVYNTLEVHNNDLKNFCIPFGQCDKFTKNFDWFTVLFALYGFIEHPLLLNCMEKKYFQMESIQQTGQYSVSDLTNKNILAHQGLPCVCREVYNGSCDRCEPWNLSSVKSPEQFLQDNYPSVEDAEPEYIRPALQKK